MRKERAEETEGRTRFEPVPARKRGRPKNRWRIRVVRIGAQKYPQFQGDRDHPFASMAAEARIEEIDSFCARLRSRTLKRKLESPAVGHIRSAAA